MTTIFRSDLNGIRPSSTYADNNTFEKIQKKKNKIMLNDERRFGTILVEKEVEKAVEKELWAFDYQDNENVVYKEKNKNENGSKKGSD